MAPASANHAFPHTLKNKPHIVINCIFLKYHAAALQEVSLVQAAQQLRFFDQNSEAYSKLPKVHVQIRTRSTPLVAASNKLSWTIRQALLDRLWNIQHAHRMRELEVSPSRSNSLRKASFFLSTLGPVMYWKKSREVKSSMFIPWYMERSEECLEAPHQLLTHHYHLFLVLKILRVRYCGRKLTR